MRVKQITVSNFMIEGTTVLDFPESGVVVITGHNGAGKSRFAEAVAYAFWGKTLRSRSPWIDGLSGHVEVVAHEGTARRSVTARGSKRVLWNGVAADTPTKTQEQITAAVGEMEFWQRTHVFSSADASNFSQATDAERKRLVEMLLSLDVFDSAQSLCSEAQKKALAEYNEAKLLYTTEKAKCGTLQAQINSLGEFAPFVATPFTIAEPCQASRDTINQLGQQVESHLSAVSVLESEQPVPPPEALGKEVAAAESALSSAKLATERIRVGRCTLCGSAFDEGDLLGAESAETTASHRVLKAREIFATAWGNYQALEAENTVVLKRTKHALTLLERELGDAQQASEKHAQWSAFRDAHEASVNQQREAFNLRAAEHAQKLENLNYHLEEQTWATQDQYVVMLAERASVAELECCTKILGVRGLRTHVLGKALEGVESVANYWLSRIAHGRTLTIRSRGTNKSGGVSDRITIEVQGFGGGDYGASSAGERRRIDTPLLLALAEVAGSTNNGIRGTLWLDEVFDALDVEGRAAVSDAIGELGQRQPTVVITHAADLASKIPAALRVEVEHGRIKS